MFPFPWGGNSTELAFPLGNWNGKNINKYKSSYTDNVLFYYPIISQKPRVSKEMLLLTICVALKFTVFSHELTHCVFQYPYELGIVHLTNKKSEAQEGS